MPSVGLRASSRRAISLRDERVGLVLVGADGPAEHDEEIGIARLRKVVATGLDVVDGESAGIEHARERAEVLERDVADRDRAPCRVTAQAGPS
jgi:hypothetical protein